MKLFAAPTDCISDEIKLELTETCFDPHEKLKALVTSCFGPSRKCSSTTNEDKVMNCIIVASTQVQKSLYIILLYSSSLTWHFSSSSSGSSIDSTSVA